MINSKLAIFLFVIFGLFAFSQEEQDSIYKDKSIEKIVITGQFEPQSIKKSVHNVRVISQADIQNLGAVNLGDVLNQYVNISVRPSGASGRSVVSMFGLDASYFKILVDNVPLVNEGGLGNNTDLSQINLNDIEQIEIIEGSMGVTHGANAVSGILNIITKKSARKKWEIATTIQEETVGEEYKIFDSGRHIQALKIGHNIDENWYVSAGGNRNDFKGFLGDFHGKYHRFSDGKRGYNWLPKEQYQANALINYKKDNFRLFYKFEFLDEQINYYQNNVSSGYSSALGSYRYGNDVRYFTDRIYNHLNGVGQLFSKINYNISVSYQTQKRETEIFRYNITHDIETNNIKRKNQSMDVLYSTGTFTNFLESEKVHLQLGYELVDNKGFSLVEDENQTIKEVSKNIDNYDVFAVSELRLNKRLSLRPGFRYSFQSMFDDQYAFSLGGRHLYQNGYESRVSVGRSYRTPEFSELYSKLIFSGHYFIGNEDLIPEKSTSFELSGRKSTFFQSGATLFNNVMVSYTNIDGRIESALVGSDGGTPIYQLININEYKSINASATNQFSFSNWNISLGFSGTWISQVIDNNEIKTDDRFLFNFNMNSGVSYFIPKWKTTLSAYYKYVGKAQQWVVGGSNYVISDIESHGWLDASIRKTFLENKVELTLGARNILDITDINQNKTNQGQAHPTSSEIMLGYGRSYFLKLTYNLNF